jgi:hypothetical protein
MAPMLVRPHSADRHDLQADAVPPDAVAPRAQAAALDAVPPIRFEANPIAAKRAGLRLSAQLLRLADVVAEHVPKGSRG